MDIGLKRLEDDLAPLLAAKKENSQAHAMYSGEKAFKLYDTFGLPLDFIVDACRDVGIGFDQDGFDSAMTEQRTRAQASWKGGSKLTASPVFHQLPRTAFEGYRQTESSGCEILALLRNGQGVQELKKGLQGEVVLDHTPFYAESGGQIGDQGLFYDDDHNIVIAEVESCYAPVQGVRAHKVIAREDLRVGDRVDAVVDTDKRWATMRHHTATHLLHAGLRQVLGTHVKQAGSLVTPGRLRFDFSHFASVPDEELQDIEDIVNREVLRNQKVETIEDVPIDVAVNEYHAMALFGEKYGDKVRVIKIGDFSTELCGGTHTTATGEIGLIKILDEGSVSSGVRRMEASAGESSLRHFRADHQIEQVARSLVRLEHPEGSLATALRTEIGERDDEIKRLKRELDETRVSKSLAQVANFEDKIRVVKGIKVLPLRVDKLQHAQLRDIVDRLRQFLKSGVVVVGGESEGKVVLVAAVTKDLTDRVQAGKVVGAVAQKVGGKGGGRPDLAEAGGKDVEALDAALGSVAEIVEGLLK
jgi:alanyl-tRNA synthetase